ncbi:hypothetical protein ACFXTH_025439 [Malus domestica]
MLKAFGCACFPHLVPYNKHKLMPKSVKCVFIGYDLHYKGYCCLDPITCHVYISRNVTFDELTFLVRSHFFAIANSCSKPSSFSSQNPTPSSLPQNPTMKAKDTLLDQQQLQNPIESGLVEPNLRAKRRRRRKKFFIVPNGFSSLAKNHHTNLNKDVDVKVVIAISVDFPVDSLMEEEIEAKRFVSVSPSMPNQIFPISTILSSSASTRSPSSPANATADPSATRKMGPVD